MWRVMGIVAFALWPIIPILWVQVHGRPKFWRKLGGRTYAVVISEWLVVAFITVTFRNFLLGGQLDFSFVSWLGAFLLALGLALNYWTGRLLGLKSLVGYSELKPSESPRKLVTVGPFSFIRHPTYLAHTLIFVGVFLTTGYTGTGVLALVDFLTSYFVIIPLEERELANRFDGDYRRYKKRVPKFLPIRLS